MHADYYYNILYPLQDQAIQAFKGSPFYLTGGTALSRGYYQHRFSDDLDYFVNDTLEFDLYKNRCIASLRSLFETVIIALSSDRFCRLYVSEEKLKIEIVNDVPAHIGTLYKHTTLGMIDSRENILANKISAFVDRGMPKDVVDLYFLLRDGLGVRQALLDSTSKAAGIAPLDIARMFYEYEYSLLDIHVLWINPIPSKVIKQYMKKVALSILEAGIR